jgi:uncharacterized protein YjbI with pentapeptide repeats
VANDEHVRRLRRGVEAWNAWRQKTNPAVVPDLGGADLDDARLSGADLRAADLSNANLRAADLSDANLRAADLSNAILRAADLSNAILSVANLNEAKLTTANLSGADLRWANLYGAYLKDANLGGAKLDHADLRFAHLINANLSKASLTFANLAYASLSRANFASAHLWAAIFGNNDLRATVGLELCRHDGPAIVDFSTLQQSHPLPLEFLRGVGLPDNLIDYLPALVNQAIQFYSCFISYSTKDDDFAHRLHADLQNRGVRCWFAPHDLPIGAKILDGIDEAIRLRDKVVLILSEQSIKSYWVEDEVNTAFEEERRRDGQTVLFPIRLDDAVMDTDEAWAAKLRASRNIGDFRQSKDHDHYVKSLERALRDLKAQPEA